MGHERFAAGREGVFDARRYFGVDRARKQAVLFEPPQGRGEHLLRDVGHPAVYLRKAQTPARVQVVEHQQGPFVAEAVHDIADGTGGVPRIGCGFRHLIRRRVRGL